jgi:hypothetical protein
MARVIALDAADDARLARSARWRAGFDADAVS